MSTTDADDIRAVVHDRLPDTGLSRTARRTATRQLTAAGAPADEIARLIGVTERTVYRYRAADRRHDTHETQTSST
ncbi:helix-turn-helix domain-containing protein [Streptomyces cylindrosporus]|uniref:Helix-turn-helix domain-containing protein n=1 Tax=Streptomyces cylindrosporus TaxID=2927583 RepID=A0ABS9Y2J7_9ACTN|nr:helix-turn-helix domain-containing protein [Streptomyces cylindrosporus]MCI3271423.1 helix-turn-helix domain-containing protein [Streptomyces cylindrosporus]